MLLADTLQQAVTVTFDIQQILTWIIVGLIAGFMAGVLIRGRRYGLISSIIVGLIGAIVGGFVFRLFKVQVPAFLAGELRIQVADVVVAFVGAAIVLLILSLVYRRRV